MTPRQITDPAEGPAILALLHRAFAGMQGRIDPPSSLHRLNTDALFASGEVWAIGALSDQHPIACVVLTPRAAVLYVGKLAVDPARQGRGLGRQLIRLAEGRARVLGLPELELQTRVELVENQATFQAMGFAKVAETAHPGHLRPTSFTYRKKVALYV
ncbi:MAG: GNAT family N-acetyltransferase [Paracoccaceae bacterium]